MNFKEFADLISFMKEDTGKKYTEEYYIYFNKKLDKASIESVLMPRIKSEFDYVIPLAIIYERRCNWNDYWVDFWGIYDNEYEPCKAFLNIAKTRKKWELVKLNTNLPTSIRKKLQFNFFVRNNNNGVTFNISNNFISFCDVQDLFDLLKHKLEEIEKI